MTHRDADDFYLTAADREEERDENLLTASRMFAALSRSPAGARAVAAGRAPAGVPGCHRAWGWVIGSLG